MKYLIKIILLLVAFHIAAPLRAQQKLYIKNLKNYQKTYVLKHEVVIKKDKKYFRFFPVTVSYAVTANFTKLTDTVGFIMKTSGIKNKKYYRYGTLDFILQDTTLQLTLYQGEVLLKDSTFKKYLFLPFTDATSGEQSYGGGRYIDLDIDEIKNNKVAIDFNKAYNPYCAYAIGYNCPIPPRENNLPVAIMAGEKDFGKSH